MVRLRRSKIITARFIKGTSTVVAYAWPYLFSFFILASCSKEENAAKQPGFAENKNKNITDTYPEASRLEFPRLKGGNSLVLIHKTDKYGVNYSAEWDLQKKAQRWSCYQMHAGNTGGSVGRYQEGYPFDDLLDTQYYFNNNGQPLDLFWGSGYDHGHICPSADRQYSSEANRQTFFLTNMQPQRNVFNAGVWAAMEQQVRNWNRGSFRDTLYVCKGGTIDHDDQIRGYIQSQMIIPKYFFMALLCKNASGYKALAFWIEHKDKDTDYPKDNQGNYLLSPYVVSIRELETLTGIDFFCNLDDDTEEHVETLPVENIKSAWGVR